MTLRNELSSVNPYAFDAYLNSAANHIVGAWRHETQGTPPPTDLGLDSHDRREIKMIQEGDGVLGSLGRIALQLNKNPSLIPDLSAEQREGMVMGFRIISEALALYTFTQEESQSES